ncbi:MAG: hypothetical protein C0475_00585 [Planctomyces sp.]|nr:hypothetical protein [Planctomyces sp.]
MRTDARRRVGGLVAALLVGAAGGVLGGCFRHPSLDQPPAARIRDTKLPVPARAQAVDDLWAEALASAPDRVVAREIVKREVWHTANPQPARIRGIEILLADEQDGGSADTRRMLWLMLPIEPDDVVAARVATIAAERAWAEFDGPIARVLARHRPAVADTDRAEHKALAALFPDQPVTRTLFRIFSTPTPEGLDPQEHRRQEQARSAAWEALARLDPDGAARLEYLRADAPAGNDPLVRDVRTAATELGTIPLTVSELDWLRQLRSFDGPIAAGPSAARRRDWWQAVTAPLARLSPEQRAGLRLRDMEAVRWAAQQRPSWLGMSRQELLAEAQTRLRGRQTHVRTGGEASVASRAPDRLESFAGQMSWGDALGLLAVDEALHAPGVADALWAQALRDAKDTSTEYGGVVEAADLTDRPADRASAATAAATPAADGFAVTLFEPRPASRQGDRVFVAPSDMFALAPHALAHYHFHAQKLVNRDFAGPGEGDTQYARTHGRHNVVLTPVGPGVMNADYYTWGGRGVIRIDLGEVVSAAGAAARAGPR